MKITLLELTNFAAIYVGLRRERLRLDFSKFDNIITIIVGEMGSGKTTILSQLHPWSNIGVLDERNSDQMIRSEKDGIKHIIFKDGEDVFDIVHKYTWTKDHHSTKSFFKFNGEELNPNGNVSSFKDLVTRFMGVDQSYLRITRLGPNVSNLIDMPWNQRKSYVASIIENVDIYTNILVEIRNMIKSCDAELSALTKQVMGVTDETLATMKIQLVELDKAIADTSSKSYVVYADISQISYENTEILAKYDNDIKSAKEKTSDRLNRYRNKQSDLQNKLSELDNGLDINKVIMDIGGISANIDTTKQNRSLLEEQYNSLSVQISQLETKKMNSADSRYLQDLVSNYEDLVKKVSLYNEQLANYKVTLSPAEINNLIADIRTLDELIFNTRAYNKKIVESIITSKYNDPVSYAKEQAKKLQDRIIRLKRQISNLRFIDSYDVTSELPKVTMDTCLICPYYTTHPNVAKQMNSGKLEAKLKSINDEISECQSRIDLYEDYAIVKSKIDQCTKLYYSIKPNVQKLGALKTADINAILLAEKSVWYDYDKIITELELAVNYNDRNVISSKLIELKSEIDKYQNLNLDEVVNQIRDKSDLLADTKAAIRECDETITKLDNELAHLNELMNNYGIIDDMKNDLAVVEKLISDDDLLLDEINKDMSKLSTNETDLLDLKSRFNQLQQNYEDDKRNYEKLSNTINIIETSKAQINDLQEKKYIYELIKDASSPQTGIPLLYVQLFLNDCISITNQLISMVLDESVEIMGLDLSKPDMKIPYRKNGQIMEDVKSASQGERAAISLALSFAFMHKCLAMNKGDFNYNILLLDEIDAPFDSNARDKCIQILAQQIKVNNVEQVFFITHNDRYDGYPVNVIATSDSPNIRKDVPLLKVY